MGKPTNSTTDWKVKALRERLQAKSRAMPSGCIEWIGHKDKKGYGETTFGKRYHLKAHRAAYALAHGLPIPFEGVIRHHCDNPACINVEHLAIGTIRENNQDRMDRNRQVRGEALPQAKLTAEQVQAIRSDPRSQDAIARDYPVSQTTIGRIKSRRIWTHI